MDRVGIQHSADRNPFVSNAHLQLNGSLISSFHILLIECMIDSLVHMNTLHPIVYEFSAIYKSLQSNRPFLPFSFNNSLSYPMSILSGSSHNKSHIFYRWFQLFQIMLPSSRSLRTFWLRSTVSEWDQSVSSIDSRSSTVPFTHVIHYLLEWISSIEYDEYTLTSADTLK